MEPQKTKYCQCKSGREQNQKYNSLRIQAILQSCNNQGSTVLAKKKKKTKTKNKKTHTEINGTK